MTTYQGMDRAALDAAYNNTLAVAESATILADWQLRSDRLAAERPQHLDLRYGEAERNRIDYFSAGAGGPVLAFIHGGYWQMRAKETFRFLAAGPLAHGIDVALIAYTLAPAKRLDGIVAEVGAAIDWLAARYSSSGVFVSGWSAGGHLTAMAMNRPAVRGGIAISGIFDLEPIRLCYLNDKLGLDADEARRNSPLLQLPVEKKPLFVTYGTAELPELQRQSWTYAEARTKSGLPGRLVPLAGHNHFTILEELARQDGALTALVRELVAG
jgi:acetyl esterase/lipase